MGINFLVPKQVKDKATGICSWLESELTLSGVTVSFCVFVSLGAGARTYCDVIVLCFLEAADLPPNDQLPQQNGADESATSSNLLGQPMSGVIKKLPLQSLGTQLQHNFSRGIVGQPESRSGNQREVRTGVTDSPGLVRFPSIWAAQGHTKLANSGTVNDWLHLYGIWSFYCIVGWNRPMCRQNLMAIASTHYSYFYSLASSHYSTSASVGGCTCPTLL